MGKVVAPVNCRLPHEGGKNQKRGGWQWWLTAAPEQGAAERKQGIGGLTERDRGCENERRTAEILGAGESGGELEGREWWLKEERDGGDKERTIVVESDKPTRTTTATTENGDGGSWHWASGEDVEVLWFSREEARVHYALGEKIEWELDAPVSIFLPLSNDVLCHFYKNRSSPGPVQPVHRFTGSRAIS
ncbi:hypothetical protein PIB30_064168 [Stylosanthes scabra]|uniref:Uncharacterized protein n=1 Tax=Stylosanthes scabra TaxID=79078 RepID=A0ABU6XK84_9FABA|nr:hypothetical protein [Stylosanthes scabra]